MVVVSSSGQASFASSKGPQDVYTSRTVRVRAAVAPVSISEQSGNTFPPMRASPLRPCFRRVGNFRDFRGPSAVAFAGPRAGSKASRGCGAHAPGNPKLAVAYVRVSTDEQRLGPDAQRQAIGEWASREAVEVLAWHADLGVGGTRELEQRPALVAALGELNVAGAGLLVVAKRDRLARDVAVASAVERAVQRCGARVVAADGAANGDGDADRFLRRILDAAAEYERALIRARTKVALQAKRARGERVGTVPFGFAVSADGQVVPDSAEQAVIRRVRDLRAAGLSVRRVVAESCKEGLMSRAGRPLSVTQVYRMLTRVDAT
jgi:DNA invertase Pin-like site-specific DNA recombinase